VSQEFYPEIHKIDGFTGDFFANGPNKLNCDFIYFSLYHTVIRIYQYSMLD
jgi:hypothetical protein